MHGFSLVYIISIIMQCPLVMPNISSTHEDTAMEVYKMHALRQQLWPDMCW